MHSASTVVSKVISTMSTRGSHKLRKTKERKKDSRKRRKRVNFSQSVKEQLEISYRTLDSFKSFNRHPSTPDNSRVCLHFLSKDYQEDGVFSQQEFPSSNLEVFGSKFLSNQKKMSKRSALKRWLRQRTNVVNNENFHLDERFHGTRHGLCFREVFECSPRLAGK